MKHFPKKSQKISVRIALLKILAVSSVDCFFGKKSSISARFLRVMAVFLRSFHASEHRQPFLLQCSKNLMLSLLISFLIYPCLAYCAILNCGNQEEGQQQRVSVAKKEGVSDAAACALRLRRMAQLISCYCARTAFVI